MKRREFLNRLIGEVTNYLLQDNPLRMVVSLHQEKDGALLSFFDDHKRNEEELDRIRKLLNPEVRRPELAEYYGMMAGQDTSWDARLKLIGWQVKHATVRNIDSGLQIDLWLGSDTFNPSQFTIDEHR